MLSIPVIQGMGGSLALFSPGGLASRKVRFPSFPQDLALDHRGRAVEAVSGRLSLRMLLLGLKASSKIEGISARGPGEASYRINT